MTDLRPVNLAAELETFRFDNQPVRTVLVNGEPWFVARDVAVILGYRDAHNATRLLDDDERGTQQVSTPGGQQQVTVISEPGLYVLSMRSDMPDAKRFRRWVTHEVLPALRKTGRFEVTKVSRRELAQMVIDEADRADRAEAQLAIAAPAADAWNTLASGDGDWAVADAAKILSRDPAVKLGQGRLFTVLYKLGWTYRQKGDGRWRVYQDQINAGRMSELPSSHYHPRTGELVIDPPQVRVKAKGLAFLLQHLGGREPLRIDP